MFFIGIIVFLFIILIIFISRKLSPVPYFPTNKKDIPLIIRSLNLETTTSVVDLGAGNGVVIFKATSEAYKRGFDTKFYAVEINPVLILILYVKRLLHRNKKNIFIIFDDFTKMSFRRFDNAVFYLYLSPKYLDIVYKKIKKEAKNPTIVSYYYRTPSVNYKRSLKGMNNIYKY